MHAPDAPLASVHFASEDALVVGGENNGALAMWSLPPPNDDTTTPTARGAAGDAPGTRSLLDAQALREKIAKLRWLLQCANGEITRLREVEAAAASGFLGMEATPAAGTTGGATARAE